MEFDFRALWYHKWTILISAVTGVVVALVYLQIATPSYQALARVLIQPQGVTPETEPYGRIDPEFLPTEAETIRSPATIRDVLKNVSIQPPPDANIEDFDPVRHILASLSVTPVLKANVLTVAYRSHNADEAVNLIDELIQAYRANVSKADNGDAASSLEIVKSREEVLATSLYKATRSYDELRRNSPMLGNGREADQQALLKLRQLSDEMAQMRQHRSDLEAKLALAVSRMFANFDDDQQDPADVSISGSDLSRSEASDSMSKQRVSAPLSVDGDFERLSLEEISEKDVIGMLREIVRFAETEDASVLQQHCDDLILAKINYSKSDQLYGPKHPEMVAAEAEVQRYEQLIRQRVETVVRGWQRQLTIAKAAEERLQEAYLAEQREVKAAEDFRVQEEHLLGEITKLEQLHASALEQVVNLQSAQQAVAAGRSTIKVTVIDEPAINDEMTWPKPKILVAACCAIGLVIGTLFVVFREQKVGLTNACPSISGGQSERANQEPEIWASDVGHGEQESSGSSSLVTSSQKRKSTGIHAEVL